jgi:hypothetical protein
VDGGADSPVELGVKFRSDVAGTVKGIRFYKASTNTGTHVGSLWTSTGTRLASATFNKESASGWQQVNFSTPVSIAADTVYIASYHCPAGHYSEDVNYFATSGVDRAPLHLLVNGVSGGNGVYSYGAAGTFPTQAWKAANYWVDLMFQPVSGTGATSLESALKQQRIAAPVRLGISAVTGGTGTSTAGDRGGAGPASTSASTDEKGGKPILVITSKVNPSSRYYAQILQDEGLNCFAVKDISHLSAATLARTDVVLLGAIPLTNGQVTMLSRWVANGGRLIAMRPDRKLAGLLGLEDTGASLPAGNLFVDPASDLDLGFEGRIMKYRGKADRYTIVSATSVAMLQTSEKTAKAYPAVTLREVGIIGGQAVAFTFDLARSVALTRQEQRAWIRQQRKAGAPDRLGDPFDAVMKSKIMAEQVGEFPRANEQQRLLANLIIMMNADRRLLPRFWYLPENYEDSGPTIFDADANAEMTVPQEVPANLTRQLHSWMRSRRNSSISNIATNSNSLMFSVRSRALTHGLTIMVPLPEDLGFSGVTYNREAVRYSVRVAEGIQYAVFEALSGDYEVKFTDDTAASVVARRLP